MIPIECRTKLRIHAVSFCRAINSIFDSLNITFLNRQLDNFLLFKGGYGGYGGYGGHSNYGGYNGYGGGE